MLPVGLRVPFASVVNGKLEKFVPKPFPVFVERLIAVISMKPPMVKSASPMCSVSGEVGVACAAAALAAAFAEAVRFGAGFAGSAGACCACARNGVKTPTTTNNRHSNRPKRRDKGSLLLRAQAREREANRTCPL